MARRDTDGKNGGIGREKSKPAQARLQEVCCFSAPFARRLHPSSFLSVPIRVIRGQNVFGLSAVIDSRYNVSEGKFFRNLLEACTASAYAKLCHDLPGLETQAE
jgi:hypothetical protein